jgi:lysophospholipase L1-like esterase
MEELTPDQLSYVLQFQHKEKLLAHIPGVNDANVAALWCLDPATYRGVRDNLAKRARAAARELLADPEFALRVDGLPFAPGSTVVGMGDSITDDDQSWLEILGFLLELRRPDDRIRVINEGVSGDTTSQLITRFLDIVLESPSWIICFAGTNDARLHGQYPTKTLVSLDETARNLDMLRHFGATQCPAHWVWITPATVIEDQIAHHWFLSPFELRWRNADLAAIAEVTADVASQGGDPLVNLQDVFGLPPDPCLLLPDGLHPSLAGQKAIVRALVERLTTGP